MNAVNANNEPIQAVSSTDGTPGNGESLRVASSNFGWTGDVHPNVVPTAKLDKFAAKDIEKK